MDQKLVDTILEQYKKLKISDHQLDRVIELCQAHQDAEKALHDLMEREKHSGKGNHTATWNMAELVAYDDTAEGKASDETYGALVDYIASLPRTKQFDLDCIMSFGRNIEYYGVCEETVEDFVIQVSERGEKHDHVYSEYLAGKRYLGKWIKTVREVVNRPVFWSEENYPHDKMMVVTIMPPESYPPKMYASLRWKELDDKPSDIWMRELLDEEKGHFVFELCEKDDVGAHKFGKNGMSLDIDRHPWLNTQNLYKLYGWTKYMSYRMVVPLTEGNQFVFRLAEAKPYAVNDFVPEDEMKRLREKLTPMELTKLFLPGADRVYEI